MHWTTKIQFSSCIAYTIIVLGPSFYKQLQSISIPG